MITSTYLPSFLSVQTPGTIDEVVMFHTKSCSLISNNTLVILLSFSPTWSGVLFWCVYFYDQWKHLISNTIWWYITYLKKLRLPLAANIFIFYSTAITLKINSASFLTSIFPFFVISIRIRFPHPLFLPNLSFSFISNFPIAKSSSQFSIFFLLDLFTGINTPSSW